MMWIAAFVIALLLYLLAGDRVLYFVLAPTLAIYATMNWDLLAVALATAGTFAYLRRSDAWSGVLLGLGAAAKLFPIFLVVPFVAGRFHGKEPDRGIRVAWAAAGTWIAVNLPFMVLTLESVIEGIDPAIEEAASSLGAPPFQVFRRVILPLAMPGVLAGTILVFILGMNAYATPILLGGPRFQMMGPLVYNQFAGLNNWPFGAALSFVLMTATLTLSAVSNLVIQRRYRR